MFKIPYQDWINIVYIFGKELHQSYEVLCNMSFFEILMIMERFNEDVEKEAERQNAHKEETQAHMEAIKRQSPKMQYKQPSIQVPKIQMPKL